MSQANAERRSSSANGQFPAGKAQPTRFRIRTAQPKDLSQIVSVLIHSFYTEAEATQWLYWILRIGIREDIKTKITPPNRTPNYKYACLVATTLHPDSAKSDQVIGTAEISQRPCETWQFFPPQRAYLSNLAISDRHRRQGAAQQLIATCEKIALGWGFRHIYLHVMADNTAAKNLYALAGYQVCEVSNPVLSSLGLRPQRLLLSKRISTQALETKR